MVKVYKIMNHIDKLDKDKLFTMSQYAGSRGHPFKIYKKRFRLNIRGNYFSKRIIDSWNELPENTVMAPLVRVSPQVQFLVLHSRREDKTYESKHVNRGCRA